VGEDASFYLLAPKIRFEEDHADGESWDKKWSWGSDRWDEWFEETFEVTWVSD
jgi:hypothetical protein